MNQAIILAAGKGTRLGGKENGHAKCLVKIAGRAMIHRQMEVLSGLGIERFFVVVGHEADLVRDALDHRCTPVHNERFLETNSLYSLWLALQQVRGPFMLLNSDVLAHPDVYRRVAGAEGAAFAYDSSSGDDDEHMKVRIENGRLREISKTLSRDDTDGENVGILRFDEAAAARLAQAADEIIRSGDHKCWAPAAVGRIASDVPICAIDVADLPWAEIDFPEDLANARTTVWPAIESLTRQGPRSSLAERNEASRADRRDAPEIRRADRREMIQRARHI